MEPLDVEKLIGELEIGVDRLRSLYEQYFMGFEKLEPTVPRKDVDRRVHTLRKEQIRNTALRFRFNMLVQRYNTYQTHWQRICREIENGTYKRHLLRAKARFGDAPAPRSRSAPPPPPPPPTDFLAAELADLDREFAPAEELTAADVLLDSDPPTLMTAKVAPQRPRPSNAPPAPLWRKAPPAPPREASGSAPDPMDDSELERLERAIAQPRPPAAPPPRPPPAASAKAAPNKPNSPGTPAAAVAAPPPRAPAAAAAAPPLPRAPAPTVPAVRTNTAPPPTAGGENLSEARVRQLYVQYVEAKRRHKESTAAITYEAVAKSLRESSAKLRERHGRAVDFEISEKDGKAILKPVLK